MPRIRTIKPEFWTSPQVSRVSYPARLLFIGTWNFADDYGNLPRDPAKLKMQVFPGDVIEVEPLIGSLLDVGLLTEYSDANEERFLHIPTFAKHQVINRPSKRLYPAPDGTVPDPADKRKSVISRTTTGSLRESSELERKGKEKEVNQTHSNDDGSSRAHAYTREAASSSLVAAEIATSLRAWERERGKAARGVTASNQQVIDLADLHVSGGELRRAYDAAVTQREADEDPTPINAGFMRVFIEKLRHPPKKREDNAWRRTPAGIERKASELGITCPPGRDYAWLAEKCDSVMRSRADANGAAR